MELIVKVLAGLLRFGLDYKGCGWIVKVVADCKGFGWIVKVWAGL